MQKSDNDFKESKEGAEVMTKVGEEYASKKVLERNKETEKSLLQNGVLADLAIKFRDYSCGSERRRG